MKLQKHSSILIILTVVLALGLPRCGWAQFNFEVTNGTATLTGYTGPGGNVVIPGTYSGFPVTAIGNNAFDNKTSVTNISIPNSVTNIGDYAFRGCSGLTNVTIPNGVTGLGRYAFQVCSALTGMAIPNSVTVIGFGAFGDCSNLTSVTFSENLTDIPGSCFYGCLALKSIVIPNSVTNVGYNAFFNCYAATNLVIGTNVAYIGQSAFSGCNAPNLSLPASLTSFQIGAFGGFPHLTNITVDAANPSYASQTGVLFDKTMTTLIRFPQALAGSYVVPNSVTTIADVSFTGCSGLTSLVFPNGVTYIGSYSFQSCPSLSSITVPSSVTFFGYYAFSYCNNLHRVLFQGNVPSPGNQAFFNDTGTAYYLPGTTGWGASFGGWPTAVWNPAIQTTNTNFGIRTNRFGFNLKGNANLPVEVDACTNLSGTWTPLFSGSLTNGLIYFSDPQWTNSPTRFYRIKFP